MATNTTTTTTSQINNTSTNLKKQKRDNNSSRWVMLCIPLFICWILVGQNLKMSVLTTRSMTTAQLDNNIIPVEAYSNSNSNNNNNNNNNNVSTRIIVTDGPERNDEDWIQNNADDYSVEQQDDDNITINDKVDQKLLSAFSNSSTDATTTKLQSPTDNVTTIQSATNITTITTTASNNTSSSPSIMIVEQTCFSWNDTNTDDWWQDHPDWQIGNENKTHTCFVPIPHEEKAEFFRQLHQVQFHGNCSLVRHRFLVGSGFAASMTRFRPAFWTAFRTNRPFQRSKHRHNFRWIYSPPYKNASDPASKNSWAACPSQDMFCYFLPISNCNYTEKVEHGVNKKLLKERYSDPWAIERYDWLLSYLMRPNHVVRQKLWELLQSDAAPKLPAGDKSFCTAMHVRRTDATTEQRINKRNYYPLAQYLEKGKVKNGTNILLLTDDQSAIDEAHILHPNYNWYYMNRTRLRGRNNNNNGKPNHIPSGDPALEILYLLAEFQLVQSCDTLIHGTSNMVNLFLHYMEEKTLVYNNDNNNNTKYVVKSIKIDSDIDNYPNIDGNVFIQELDEKLQNYTNNNNNVSSAVLL